MSIPVLREQRYGATAAQLSGVPSRPRSRASYVALTLATTALGLTVHRSGRTLPPTARDGLGDALWAAMIAWLAGAAAPRVRLAARSAAALAVCAAVEFGQLYRQPALDALRRTPLGHLVLGSDFDARDLGAYVLGVLAAALLERALARRRAGRRRPTTLGTLRHGD